MGKIKSEVGQMTPFDLSRVIAEVCFKRARFVRFLVQTCPKAGVFIAVPNGHT